MVSYHRIPKNTKNYFNKGYFSFCYTNKPSFLQNVCFSIIAAYSILNISVVFGITRYKLLLFRLVLARIIIQSSLN
jgi:hypothetical protein